MKFLGLTPTPPQLTTKDFVLFFVIGIPVAVVCFAAVQLYDNVANGCRRVWRYFTGENQNPQRNRLHAHRQ